MVYPRTPYYIRTKKSGVLKAPPQKEFSIVLSDSDLDALIKIIEFGQLEIHRHFKKFSDTDFDLKDIFFHYRSKSNEIRRKLRNLRGF